MDYTESFWTAWRRLLSALSHDRQAEVLSNPGGYEWRTLAAAAATEAEA